MRRIQAIESIIKNCGKQALYITCNGMISREFYKLNKKYKYAHFPMLGSMGTALAIGLGLAMNTHKKVVVIDGDANILMSLGTMLFHKKHLQRNLFHVILNNNENASTGGQPTIGLDIFFDLYDTLIIPIRKGNEESMLRINELPIKLRKKFQKHISPSKNKKPFIAGVPCSKHKEFLSKHKKYVINTSEPEALGMAFGAVLAGRKSIVYLQNSGLFNSGDTLISLIKLFGMENKVKLLISNRTRPIQHKEIGEKTYAWLKLVGYSNYEVIEQ